MTMGEFTEFPVTMEDGRGRPASIVKDFAKEVE